jgi:hypothetical protein
MNLPLVVKQGLEVCQLTKVTQHKLAYLNRSGDDAGLRTSSLHGVCLSR